MSRTLPIFVVLVILGLIAIVAAAYSAPPENADPALAPWFQSLRQPGTGASCCSIADCRPVDYQGSSSGGYEVYLGLEAKDAPGFHDGWVPVPKDKVLDGKDNPVGRAVVCWTPALGVLCFVRGTEA